MQERSAIRSSRTCSAGWMSVGDGSALRSASSTRSFLLLQRRYSAALPVGGLRDAVHGHPGEADVVQFCENRVEYGQLQLSSTDVSFYKTLGGISGAALTGTAELASYTVATSGPSRSSARSVNASSA